MRTGRPTKLKPQVQRVICEAMLKGCTKATAAAAAGINVVTLNDWDRRGQNDLKADEHTIYSDFSIEYRSAQQKAFETLTRRVFEASEKEWRAAAWILERRDPEHWGKWQNHNLTAGEGVDVVVNIGIKGPSSPAKRELPPDHLTSYALPAPTEEGE